MRSTANGGRKPPAFDDWGSLFVDGIVYMVLAAVYSVVPVLVFIVMMVFTGGLGTALGGAGAEGGAFLSVLVGMLAAFGVASVFGLVVYYVMPAALYNYARKDSLGAAFSPGDLKAICLSGEYLKAWLVVFLVGTVVGTIMGVIGAIPFVGQIAILLIAPVVGAYMGMFGHYAYARGAGSAV